MHLIAVIIRFNNWTVAWCMLEVWWVFLLVWDVGCGCGREVPRVQWIGYVLVRSAPLVVERWVGCLADAQLEILQIGSLVGALGG